MEKPTPKWTQTGRTYTPDSGMYKDIIRVVRVGEFYFVKFWHKGILGNGWQHIISMNCTPDIEDMIESYERFYTEG